MRHNLNRSPCGEKGFTLIEVMVAIIIFAIVAIGSMSFFAYGRGQINNSGNKRIGLELARAKMEQLKATDYGSLSSLSETNLGLGRLKATRTTTVTTVSGANGNYKQVSVQVQWPQGQTSQYSIALNSIIAQP